MTDLVIFVGIVGLVVVIGVVVGMIVAGRLDRMMSPAAGPPAPGEEPAASAESVPEQEQQP